MNTERRKCYQNPTQFTRWLYLPGATRNWTYLAFGSGRIAARNGARGNRFLFVRRDNIGIETAGFDRDQLDRALSFNPNIFGINDVANWRRNYGFLFQLFN